jgi:hypothetical protein
MSILGVIVRKNHMGWYRLVTRSEAIGPEKESP